MNLLIKILQAAHCRSTHQFFVMDALPLVTSPRAQRLSSVLLKHHEAYLIGSKDPDKTFRDFRNHVLHIGDNNWGGATKSVEKWYGILLREIDAQNWQEAAYAAGVLSHYFTDPLMPLHTGQSDKESIVHRPLEWSVTKSYQRIRASWQSNPNAKRFVLPQGDKWITQSVIRGATVAHSYYDELIDRYDLAAGCKNPPAGLDRRSIDILSNLFGMAITGWAQILQRAADESRAAIPHMPLKMATVVATLKMPSAWVTRRIESKEEKAAVQAIFDEFVTTGTVSENLPSEVATVKHEREIDRIEETRQANSKPPVAKQSIGLANPSPQEPSVLPMRSTSIRAASLAATDDLVDAPSIGPKTAKRFEKIGIRTVAEFLAASAVEMATNLDTRWITTDKIRDWQAQAKLVCEVASLCGYKSQLLVGVGCRDTATLAKQQPAELHELLSDFAETSDGQRILRSSRVPPMDNVVKWVEDAMAYAAASTPSRKSA
jgi:predicted flap endonuclease-1-like 5' DNA nuclease